MQSLRKLDAYFSKSFVLVRIAFDGVLGAISRTFKAVGARSCRHTATGLANVLTKREVTLSVRDISGHYGRASNDRGTSRKKIQNMGNSV
jgi:hypothetical protein